MHGGRYGSEVSKNHLLQSERLRLHVCMHKLKMAAILREIVFEQRLFKLHIMFSVAKCMPFDSTKPNLNLVPPVEEFLRPHLHKIINIAATEFTFYHKSGFL